MFPLLCLLFMAQQPFFINARATQGPGTPIDNNGMRFSSSRWVISIEPLPPAALEQRFIDHGVDPAVIKRADLQQILGMSMGFLISLENLSDELLVFNPDQVMLYSSRGPAGFLMDMAHFWPPELPRGNPRLETFAMAFAKGMVQVEPGKKHQQMLLFRPNKDRFRKKVELRLDRVYYGIEGFDIRCGFDVRYH